MSLIYLLQNLASSITSLMFELEENPAPTHTIENILKRISKINTITLDRQHYKGGLSHFNDFLTIKNIFFAKMVTFTADMILPQKNN